MYAFYRSSNIPTGMGGLRPLSNLIGKSQLRISRGRSIPARPPTPQFATLITFNGSSGVSISPCTTPPPPPPSPNSPSPLPCLRFLCSAYSCSVFLSSLSGSGGNPLRRIHRVQRVIQSWGMPWISPRTSLSGKTSPRWLIVMVRFQVIPFRGNSEAVS